MSEQYVLAKPIKAKLVKWPTPAGCEPGDYSKWHIDVSDATKRLADYRTLDRKVFQELFVPLSVREQQIREIVTNLADEMRCLKPLEEKSDIVYHNIVIDAAVAAISGIEQ